MSDNIPEWLRPYIESNSYIPTKEDIENLEPQSIKEMMLKYIALNSGGEEEDKYAAFKARVDGSLTEVTADMLQGVTSIGNYAFYNCSNLTSITISNGVTRIGNAAFNNCTSLTSIEIPNSVTSIGSSVFMNCGTLTVTVKATTPPSLGNSAFSFSTPLIYVPAESLEAYKAASGWSTYASKIQAIPSS